MSTCACSARCAHCDQHLCLHACTCTVAGGPRSLGCNLMRLCQSLHLRAANCSILSQDPAFPDLSEKALPLFRGLLHFVHAAVHEDPANHSPFRPDDVCPFMAENAEDESAAAAVTKARRHLALAWKAASVLAGSATYSPLVLPALLSVSALAPLVAWILLPCRPGAVAPPPPLRPSAYPGSDSSSADQLCCYGAEMALSLVAHGTRISDVKARLNGGISQTGQGGEALCTALVRALLCTVHTPCSADAHSTALTALGALVTAPEPCRVCLEDGGAVVLLDAVFACPPVAVPAAVAVAATRVRASTTALLALLLAQSTVYQQRQVRQLEALLPPALLKALTHCVGSETAFIADVVDAPVDTPELVWSLEMRERTAGALRASAEAAAVSMRAGGQWDAGALPPIVHPELEYDMYVGGVYLKRFLDTSKASASQELRDPRAFLDGLMLELDGAMDAALAAGDTPPLAAAVGVDVVPRGDLARMLGRAAELVLGRYSGLPAHAAAQGYVEWLVAKLPLFSPSEELQAVGGIALRVLLQLALAPASSQRLAAPTPALIPCLQSCIPWNLGAAIFALDILRCGLHTSNPDRDELVHQAAVHSLVPQLLGLLEPDGGAPAVLVPGGYVSRAGVGSDAKAKADSDIVRNLAVEIVHKLVRSDVYADEVCPPGRPSFLQFDVLLII
jgi:hypothetical protein